MVLQTHADYHSCLSTNGINLRLFKKHQHQHQHRLSASASALVLTLDSMVLSFITGMQGLPQMQQIMPLDKN